MDTDVKKFTSQSHTDSKLEYEKSKLIKAPTETFGFIDAKSKTNSRTNERKSMQLNMDGSITDTTHKKSMILNDPSETNNKDTHKKSISLSSHSQTEDNLGIKRSSFIKTESKIIETSSRKLKSTKEIQTDQSKLVDPQSTVSKSAGAFGFNSNSATENSQTSISSGPLGDEEATVTPPVSPSEESLPSSGSNWTNFQPTSFYIDFTPNEDDERNYKKCMQFWDYIHSHKDLTDMLVSPEEEKDECLSNKQTVHQIIEEQRREREIVENRLPVLKKFIDLDDDMVKLAFLVRDCPKTCDTTATGASDPWSPKCTYEAKKICKAMEEFDKSHSKSMEPPSHPPPISHAEMQRCPDRIKF